MTSGFYGPEDFGSSSFDDFLARIYGGGGGVQRPAQRVDITRLKETEIQLRQMTESLDRVQRVAGIGGVEVACGVQRRRRRAAVFPQLCARD